MLYQLNYIPYNIYIYTVMLLYFFLELKNRIILITLTWSTIFIICYNYKEILFIGTFNLALSGSGLINLTDIYINL